jgi:hypothetical protein
MKKYIKTNEDELDESSQGTRSVSSSEDDEETVKLDFKPPVKCIFQS